MALQRAQFDVKALEPSADAMVRCCDGMTLVSSTRPRWWFVATAPISSPGDSAAPLAVQLEVEVLAGTVGISLMGSDNATLFSEIERGPGRAESVSLRADGSANIRHLLLRSVDALDRPTVVRVSNVRAIALRQ